MSVTNAGYSKAMADLDRLTFSFKEIMEANQTGYVELCVEEGFKLADKNGYSRDLVMEYVYLWFDRTTNCSSTHKQRNTRFLDRLNKKFLKHEACPQQRPHLSFEDALLKFQEKDFDVSRYGTLRTEFNDLVVDTVSAKGISKANKSKSYKIKMFNACVELKERFRLAGFSSPVASPYFKGELKKLSLSTLVEIWRESLATGSEGGF